MLFATPLNVLALALPLLSAVVEARPSTYRTPTSRNPRYDAFTKRALAVASTNTCVTISADSTVVTQASVGITPASTVGLQSGDCLCLDSDATADASAGLGASVDLATITATLAADPTSNIAANVRVVLYSRTNGGTTTTITGSDAVSILRALAAGSATPGVTAVAGTNNIIFDTTCDETQLGVLTGPNTVHDFSSTAANCCARKCDTGYVDCGGECYEAGTITCSSGIPVQNAKRKRSMGCPSGHTMCPVAGSSLGWECVDTTNDIESCGGCQFSEDGVSQAGVDCTEIPNVGEVRCLAGACTILSCQSRYRLSANGTSCEPTARKQFAQAIYFQE